MWPSSSLLRAPFEQVAAVVVFITIILCGFWHGSRPPANHSNQGHRLPTVVFFIDPAARWGTM
jgi:hypothetical protein